MQWLRGSREWREARRGARRLELEWAVIYYKPGTQRRFGVATVRGLRGVRRNRVRRRLREVVRLVGGCLPQGTYIILGKERALSAGFLSMARGLLEAFWSSE